MNTATKSRLAGLPDGFDNGQRSRLATGGDYTSSITPFPPSCQSQEVASLIATAQRLVFDHDQAAAQAARSLAFHTGAAAKQRAILRELRELAGRRP
jgi:hypothetical protein